MYYLNNRYYNPQWGRFISADVILSSNSEMNSYNLYVYAGNNPINNTDPNGNSSKSIIKKTIKIIKKTVKKVTTIIKNIIKQSTKKASSSKKTTPKTNYTPPGSNPKYSNLPDYTDEVNKLLIKNCGQAKVIMDNFSPSDTLKYFYDINQPGAEFDYKIENVWNAQLGVPYPKENNGQFLWEGYVLTPEDLGNLNYGFVGTFMGFEEEILYAGGGYANQGISTELFSAPYFGDNPNDHIAINIGIYYYNNGMKINYDDFYDYIFNN